MFTDQIYLNLLCEKTTYQIHAENLLLVWIKKAISFAVLAELDRFPLHFDIKNVMISFVGKFTGKVYLQIFVIHCPMKAWLRMKKRTIISPQCGFHKGISVSRMHVEFELF